MPFNKKHKDTVFSALFSNEPALLELYNALTGAHYTLETANIKINTLSGALYNGLKNDVSFTIDGKLVVLIEHQSSINANMPFRLLLYVSRIYEKLTNRKDTYRERLIKIPFPEFIVLYNGTKDFPKHQTLKLSDAFEQSPMRISKHIPLELVVDVYNINRGKSEPWVQKSPTLSGYSLFVSYYRELLIKDIKPKEAFKATIEYCKKHNALVDFLTQNSSQEINMLLTTKFNIEEAKEVWREEALEEGREEGREEGIEEGIKKGREYGELHKAQFTARRMLDKGYPLADIIELTGLSKPEVEILKTVSPRKKVPSRLR